MAKRGTTAAAATEATIDEVDEQEEQEDVIDGGKTLESFELSKTQITKALNNTTIVYKDHEVMLKAKEFVQEKLQQPPVMVLGNIGCLVDSRTYLSNELLNSLNRSMVLNFEKRLKLVVEIIALLVDKRDLSVSLIVSCIQERKETNSPTFPLLKKYFLTTKNRSSPITILICH